MAATLCLAIFLLAVAADLRPFEYDEAYSIFLTAGDARPAWPQHSFQPSAVRKFYISDSTPQKIAHDLRAGDVHPPLYFWILEYWRRLVGPGWFAARMLSVIFSVAGLAALAWLAALAEIPPAPTMLIALLSYGFAYTGVVARGFALAQLLNIFGLALTMVAARDRKWQWGIAAGIAFGAAGFSNYLAIFIGLGTICWLAVIQPTRKLAFPAALGLTLFLPLIVYFFVAQRDSRVGQFVAFSVTHALVRLATLGSAALFGGLPLYAGRASGIIAAGLAIVILCCIGLTVKNWRPKLLLFAITAIAMPLGLLVLGFIFNNMPIEIRYLGFSMPSVALLLSQTLPRNWRYLVLGIEACGFAGLCLSPRTMQPQALAAHQLPVFETTGTLVLLPYSNDGVGVPGPFIAAAPDQINLQLVKPDTTLDLAVAHRLILVTINADAASRAVNAKLFATFDSNRCWQRQSATPLMKVFTRSCGGSQASH